MAILGFGRAKIMFLESRILSKLCAFSLQKVPLARCSSKVDPGARRRLKIAKDNEQVDLDNLDYEANFETLGYSHKQYMEELKAMKDKLQYDIVKQKYFKSKYPNFLTWHDKEQIRQLHNKDPEEWDVMKLSEGFPALPDIIKKIIKSKWRMENAEKMKNHDEMVRENWRKLKNNEYGELPRELVEHLMKFSNRKFSNHNYSNVVDYSNIEFKPKLTCSEFSEIITSYEELIKKDKSPKTIESKNIQENMRYTKESNLKSNEKANFEIRNKSLQEEDTFYIEPIRNKQPMTLNTLRNKLQNNLKKGKEVSFEDVSIIGLDGKELAKDTAKIDSSLDQLDYTKYNTGKLMKIDEKKPHDYNHLMYPEKIKIPKTAMKKGQTYKLNDCFYDSDGTFLYRVPGM